MHSFLLHRVKDFVRKLQWAHALPAPSDKPRFGLLPSSRWPPRSLVPERIRRLSTRIIHGCRSLVRCNSCSSFRENLSADLRSELLRLQQCDSVVATADKGGKWTITSRDSYNDEALRQLSVSSFYQRIPDDNSRVVRSRVSQILNHLRSRRFITKRELHFLLPPSLCKERSFRLLPKLHKLEWPNPDMPPGRPIISDSGSITRRASNLVEFFLQPLCQRLPSHLKDSGHLLALLRSTTISATSLLFTFDVASLYTNVPIDEGIDCVSQAFLRHPDDTRPDATILSLLRLLLTSNSFTFGGQRWLQVHGVAMGKTFGGSFANLFLGVWEHKALSSFSLRPMMWVRYQDDIFGVWDHGEASLLLFQQHLNAQHPRISLSIQYGRTVNFLDLHITASDRRFEYSVFAKDTDTHFVLTKDSHHPPHTFRGIIFGELLRFATHSSSRENFNRTVSEVTPVWRSLGYSRAMIRACKTAVLTRTSQLSSWPTGMFPCTDSSCSVCPFAVHSTTFSHPYCNILYPIICRISCNTPKCIYLIRCKKCKATYVGQTQRSLKERILQHLRKMPDGDSPLYRHFNNICGPDNFSFLGIDTHPNDARRLQKELLWIDALNTRAPKGLNVIANKTATSNLIVPYARCSTRVTSAIKKWCGSHVQFRACFTRSRNLGELLSMRQQHSD